MLYEDSKSETLADDLFYNPPAYYGGAPFWSWNCRITKEIIDEQLIVFKEMGMGGFHIHVRVGLENEYLSDEFMELVSYCNEQAKKLGLRCYLYDEDRYSSGTAGGMVTKDINCRQRYLRFTTKILTDHEENQEVFKKKISLGEPVAGYFLVAYDIVLVDGYLKSAKPIPFKEDKVEGMKWYVYVELAKPTPWYNNQTYADLLNENVTKKFIEYTHERYAEYLQDDFGGNIPSIFTDEPMFCPFDRLSIPDATDDVRIPYTDDIPATYRKATGRDVFEDLPEVIWERDPNCLSQARYLYRDHIAQRFVNGYMKPISDWCKAHNLGFTGHLMAEQDLEGQSNCAGDVMRSYKYFSIPGVDNLCDLREFNTLKQAQSSKNQFGNEGMTSELYGVNQWDFDFRHFKHSGDWQAALGVTNRVHHLTLASMKGEAKRDYPASIGYQSPWYTEFSYIENHFKRLNTVLTRGKAIVKIGVIHPVETMWLYLGPTNQTHRIREQLDRDFRYLTEWLLMDNLDFDFIAESLLVELTDENVQTPFKVGNMQYDVILVPNCITLRSTTVKRLLSFQKAGGQVIFAGKTPKYIDAVKNNTISSDLEAMMEKGKVVPITKFDVLDALEPYRIIGIQYLNGQHTNQYIYQMREDMECQWLFIAQAYNEVDERDFAKLWRNRREFHDADHVMIWIKGIYDVVFYDTVSGKITPIQVNYRDGKTGIKRSIYGDDSLLFRLIPTKKADCVNIDFGSEKRKDHYVDALAPIYTGNETSCDDWYDSVHGVKFTLSEPNVFLLDKAQYALDNGEWHRKTELLRIDNIIRSKLNYPLRTELVAQPYITGNHDVRDHILHLKYEIISHVETGTVHLAMEELSHSKIYLNGKPIKIEVDGYYTDKSIEKMKLPGLKKGKNIIQIEMAYGVRTNLEWMYLLGNFGVVVHGAHKHIEELPDRIFFGSWTTQGLPFYSGNVTYQFLVNQKNDYLKIQVPYFHGALLKVYCDKQEVGNIAFLPYEIEIHGFGKGLHSIEITCYSNRSNSFGQVHQVGDYVHWKGADSWRSKGNLWSEEYQLIDFGILTTPRIGDEII